MKTQGKDKQRLNKPAMGYKNKQKQNKKNKKKNKKALALPFTNYLKKRGGYYFGTMETWQKRGIKMKFHSTIAGEQDTPHFVKDQPLHNFHYWLIDLENRGVIDPTPPEMPPVDGCHPIYIPWSKEEQDKQKAFNMSLLPPDVEEWADNRIKNKIFEQKRCFQNCMSICVHYPKKYLLVCGSMGWMIGENDEGVTGINLDYGY